MNKQSYLIVGGSSGLGEACVRRLAAAGHAGVIADIKPPLQPLVDECGGRFVFCQADARDEAAIRTALTEAQQRFGPVRGAVVCAGVLHAERILARQGVCDLEAFRRVVEVNLIGTFNVLRLAASVMQNNEPDAEGERGVIVMTSSTAAFDGQIGQASYAASKGGIAAMTLPAARELGKFGIRVVAIAPGAFDTPMMEAASPEQRQALESQVPFPPRFGRPEEFAALVEHVLANHMLNGAVLRLDGGLRMSASSRPSH
jgi:NAD(P)-dependent dehydrogenase (short-subunit alcohol dehydrogenase family)